MVSSTRSSARLAANQSSTSPPKSTASSAGRKRKAADSSPQQSGKGKKDAAAVEKKQKTIEETMPDAEENSEVAKDESEVKQAGDGNGVTDEGVRDQDMQDVAEDGGADGDGDQDMQDGDEKGESKAEKSEGGEKNENGDDKADNDKDKNGEEKKIQELSNESHAVNTNGSSTSNERKDEEPSAEAAATGEGEPLDQQMTQDEKDIMAAHPAKDDDGKLEITTSMIDDRGNAKQNGNTETKDEKNGEATSKAEASSNTNGAVEESKERKEAMPSNILEKGIIYFFVRGRVGVDDPDSVQDIARSYIVLRPLPAGAKLGDGALEDTKNNRLLALPKKVLPKSGRDQFLTFVEKARTTIADLKENFMQGSSYETKTTGVRHSPAVTPIGEGVYAITTVGRDSHIAYMLTIPSELGEVQKDMGLREKGSFVASVKNPEQKGPANANLPQTAEYPKEIIEEFQGRRWLPLQPKHLEYEFGQMLLIGEGHGDEGFGKALEAEEKDKKDDKKETPLEEVEKLGDEDHERVEGLKGDEAEAVFADLHTSHEDYPKLMTTW